MIVSQFFQYFFSHSRLFLQKWKNKVFARLFQEPVVITGGWRIGEGFCCWSRQIFAAILDVWQENLTKTSGKRPAKTPSNGCDYRFMGGGVQGQSPCRVRAEPALTCS